MSSRVEVVVASVCTFGRPKMLRRCLDSLAAQIPPDDIALQILVVDNEAEPNNRAHVDAFAETCPFPVHYVHQPKRGIAAARNAILDKAMALGVDWIAMLDDDETAAPDWIAQLMVPEYRAYPVLIGRCEQVYSDPRPFWAPENATRPLDEGAPARFVRTGNVRFLASLAATPLRFDDALGLIGGEDQRFFDMAKRMGFEARQTNRAVVYEPAHPQRLTYRYIIERHYAHSASLAFRRRQDRGLAPLVLGGLPRLALAVPLGLVEFAASPLAYPFGRNHFKKFVLRGGKRLAYFAGTIAAITGHLPQPYKSVVGH